MDLEYGDCTPSPSLVNRTDRIGRGEDSVADAGLMEETGEQRKKKRRWCSAYLGHVLDEEANQGLRCSVPWGELG